MARDSDINRHLQLQLRMQRMWTVRWRRTMAAELREVSLRVKEQLIVGGAAIEAAIATVNSFLPRYERTMGGLVISTWQNVGKRVLDDITKDVGDEFVRLQTAYLQEFGLTKAQAMSAVTKQWVLDELEAAIAAGESARDAAKRFARAIAGAGRLSAVKRALVIARTEVHSAAIASMEAAVGATRLQPDREWAVVRDSRARDAHITADGQIKPWGESFDVGGETLRYPGDPQGGASNVVHCRCQILYRME